MFGGRIHASDGLSDIGVNAIGANNDDTNAVGANAVGANAGGANVGVSGSVRDVLFAAFFSFLGEDKFLRLNY